MQAVGQMMTDDWCAGVAEEWDNFPGKATDWRFTGMPQNDTLEITVLSDDSAVDIEGRPFLPAESLVLGASLEFVRGGGGKLIKMAGYKVRAMTHWPSSHERLSSMS